MIISVVAAKIWYLKNVQFLLGHPVYLSNTSIHALITWYADKLQYITGL